MISYNSQTMCEKFSNRVLFYIKKFENSLKLPRVLFSISLIIYIYSVQDRLLSHDKARKKNYDFAYTSWKLFQNKSHIKIKTLI